MTPERAGPETDWAGLLGLIRAEFAFMDGRIDPPSSMHALTAEAIAAQAAAGEVWLIADQGRPVACVFLTVRPGGLYLGKLAVAGSHRGRGLARQLVETAADRARALGLPALDLQTRVELTENHATFRALGFLEVGATPHPGYSRPTSLTFRKMVPPE